MDCVPNLMQRCGLRKVHGFQNRSGAFWVSGRTAPVSGRRHRLPSQCTARPQAAPANTAEGKWKARAQSAAARVLCMPGFHRAAQKREEYPASPRFAEGLKSLCKTWTDRANLLPLLTFEGECDAAFGWGSALYDFAVRRSAGRLSPRNRCGGNRAPACVGAGSHRRAS